MTDSVQYPIDPWAIVEQGIDLERLAQSESLLALSNGHIGLRGNLDEGEPRGLSGTYLNGFYESFPLEYGERGYGFAEDGQALINVTDGKTIRLQVEDEPLDVHRGHVEQHERRLDFRRGVLERRMRWRAGSGARVQITTKRMVSLSLRSVVAISYEVEAVDEPIRVTLQSHLQANQIAAEASTDPRKGRALRDVLVPRLSHEDDLRVVLGHETRASGLKIAAGMDHLVIAKGEIARLTQLEPDLGRVTFSAQLHPGEPLRLIKFISYHWSAQQSVEWLRDQVDASLESALAEGFDELAREQQEALDEYWERADIELEGDPQLQQALRFSMFHLFQTAARNEGRAIPAKGLTGTGYDGHAFWDSEMFVLPVLTFAAPNAVRAALEWRHGMLDIARLRAQQFGLSGAAFPWRTIRGEECSGYWPAGTAAFHVNAGVAAAVTRYVAVTGDVEFERGAGADLLVETARLWVSLGYHDDQGGFRIDGVTGPDEYSALVDNNVYTNLMAQANLQSAVEVVDRHPDVAQRLGVQLEERAAWKRAAEKMVIPFDERRGIHPQDETFLRHEPWDFEGTPNERYPLLLHFPYLQLYRKQVVKQADLVLGMHWRGDAFTAEQKRANFEYYESLCVRDSSLSACTQAVLAAEVGHLDLAESYLHEAAFMDLEDLARNTGDGLHMASLAGAVLATVAGLGGLRDHPDSVVFRPRLSKSITRLRFALEVRGALVGVDIEPHQASYRLIRGKHARLIHWDQTATIVNGDTKTLPIPSAPQLEPPQQPAGRQAGRSTVPAASFEQPTATGGVTGTPVGQQRRARSRRRRRASGR